MIDWFSTACCLYGARSKSEPRAYASSSHKKRYRAGTGTGMKGVCSCSLLLLGLGLGFCFWFWFPGRGPRAGTRAAAHALVGLRCATICGPMRGTRGFNGFFVEARCRERVSSSARSYVVLQRLWLPRRPRLQTDMPVVLCPRRTDALQQKVLGTECSESRRRVRCGGY
jgi:hypothetical protein